MFEIIVGKIPNQRSFKIKNGGEIPTVFYFPSLDTVGSAGFFYECDRLISLALHLSDAVGAKWFALALGYCFVILRNCEKQ